MKVLVTGGAGFIGSHIVDLLIIKGMDVIVVDSLIRGNRSFVPGKVYFYAIDVGSHRLEEIVKYHQPDIVIHHAAQISVPTSNLNPIYDSQQNIVNTINLLNMCVKYKVKKILYNPSLCECLWNAAGF